MSVFGNIHPEIFRLSAPLGSGSPAGGVGLESFEPLVGFDVLPNGRGMLPEASAPACRNAPFEDRFAALEDHAAPFDKRFASTGDCPASFDESLASAMEVLASTLRLPAAREVPKKRADAPQGALAKPQLRLGPTRNAFPAEDDGRTPAYNITPPTAHLPPGRP